MKTCFKCGSSKDEDEFYRHPQMSDGRLGKCKECCKSDVKSNRQSKVEYYREFDVKRNALPHRVEARNSYHKTPEGHVKHVGTAIRWKKKNPFKVAIHRLVERAVRGGRLTKKPCERCGAVRSQAHHESYDRPLDVTWLCAKHHYERHKEMRELGINP
jgi:hypothetical protein